MAKKSTLQVKGTTIRTLQHNGIDYICITDIARQKNPAEPKDVVKNWMRLKNTLEYLGLWEQLNNPTFKGVEFDPLLAEAGSNAFTMSPSRWVELTGAVGILSKNGAGGGTYAQRDIAFKFASWVSVEFELYLVKEFQRLKEQEQALLGWSAKRELSKINYHIHTDAIKQNLIPAEVTAQQASRSRSAAVSGCFISSVVYWVCHLRFIPDFFCMPSLCEASRAQRRANSISSSSGSRPHLRSDCEPPTKPSLFRRTWRQTQSC